jgi:hypothetical protein
LFFIYWTALTLFLLASSNVNVQGVIPGGQSFSVPVGTLTNAPGNAGVGFNWTPALLAGTTVLVVVGDQRGLGTGGSAQFVVSDGPNSSCITSTSPTSTAGPSAGGIVTVTTSVGSGSTGGGVPTSTSIGGGSTSGDTNTSGGTSTGGSKIRSASKWLIHSNALGILTSHRSLVLMS